MIPLLPVEAERVVETIRQADLVVCVPMLNNERTIRRVAEAVTTGLATYFPQFRAVAIYCDSGSRDHTRQEALSGGGARVDSFLLDTPLPGAHRLSLPYHGVPGKDTALQMTFDMARRVNAKACAVVEAGCASVTPEWIDLLLRPVVTAGYDFVSPVHQSHKYDGGITTSLVYPLTRALYGQRVRRPAAGDLGVSGRMMDCLLALDEWETDVARFGIDVWLTTAAIAEGYRIAECRLGEKRRDSAHSPQDLASMLEQVAGSVFTLMETYEDQWVGVTGSRPVESFGPKFETGLDPLALDVSALARAFVHGRRELDEILRKALSDTVYHEVWSLPGDGAFLPDRLWTRIVFDFACAYHFRSLGKGVLLRSLAPLYLTWYASFVRETEPMIAAEVEARIEQLCMEFEQAKPLLTAQWRGDAIATGVRG
jgi:hypothetical protein